MKRNRQSKPLIQLFRQNIIRYTFKGYICVIKKRTDTRLTYLFDVNHDRTTIVENEKVSAESCAEMMKSRKCKYGELRWRNGILQTNNPVTAYDPGWTRCCRKNVFKTYNCFVFPAKFFKAHHIHHMTSTGADVDLCDYQKGSYQLKDGAYASWTPNSTERCQYIPHTTIYGTTTETHFLNDEQYYLLNI